MSSPVASCILPNSVLTHSATLCLTCPTYLCGSPEPHFMTSYRILPTEFHLCQCHHSSETKPSFMDPLVFPHASCIGIETFQMYSDAPSILWSRLKVLTIIQPLKFNVPPCSLSLETCFPPPPHPPLSLHIQFKAYPSALLTPVQDSFTLFLTLRKVHPIRHQEVLMLHRSSYD